MLSSQEKPSEELTCELKPDNKVSALQKSEKEHLRLRNCKYKCGIVQKKKIGGVTGSEGK